DVRFLSATNRDLEAEIERGTFREDLFFRLNGIMLVVPPLRERPSEIEPLAKLFISEICRLERRESVPELSADALALLMRYYWPGNVRELRNVIERAVLLGDGGAITTAHLPSEKMSARFPRRRTRGSRSSREGRPSLAPPSGQSIAPPP